MYKYMSYELRDRMAQASRSVYRRSSIPKEVLSYRPEVDVQELVGDMNLDKLRRIFETVMKRQEEKLDPIRSKFGKIEKEEVSLPDKMTYVEAFARKKRKFSFRDLLEKQCSKTQIVVTFLAILELMKTGLIRISQEHIFDDINIEVRSSEGA